MCQKEGTEPRDLKLRRSYYPLSMVTVNHGKGVVNWTTIQKKKKVSKAGWAVKHYEAGAPSRFVHKFQHYGGGT